ncbi:RHS repeat-associated core domain-containing protein, partial [Blastococcus sp. DSM 46786]|uniref:RHS repeat-associated core domain-containing protein n=1 Tax=Blastococcus sp. DSM 46786 TaxID=1798227 RepID=UPI000B81B75F
MAAAVVMGQVTGVLAAPSSGPEVDQVVSATLQPVLKASAPAGVSGQSLKFYARTVGSSTWNLLDGTTVSGSTGTAQVPAGELSIQETFEYRAELCDTTGCTSSAVETGQVAGSLGAGPRPGASTVPFTISDTAQARVDTGSGNLMISLPGLTLPRVAGDLSVGAVYNSLSQWRGGDGFQTSLSSGWRLSTGSDVYLSREATSGIITYYGPNGLTGVFQPAGGTAYTAPAGFKMDLTGDAAGGWSLTDHASRDVRAFNTAGQLTTLTDRNGNQTTFAYSGLALTEVVSDQGPAAARTLQVGTAGGGSKQITELTQTPAASSNLSNRSVAYDYDAAGRLQTVTDALGRASQLGYDAAGRLASITAPGNVVTRFGYDDLGRVLSVDQPTGTSASGAVTRFGYDDAHTYLADANTDQGQAVTTVPHSTYELTGDGMKLIASVTDPAGHQRSTTYTPFLDVASATDAAGATTTASYDANGGESLTGVQAATGAASAFTYGNTGAAQYLPASATDAQGNQSLFTYDGAGNGLSATDAASSSASVTYNADGTVKDSTSPSGAVTSYTYNSDKQLTAITPPADSSLAQRNYTYDGFGRLATFTNGNGITQTYRYDAGDRTTQINFSAGSSTIYYRYDTRGHQTSRQDNSGTTTYGYDPLGRLTSRVHSIQRHITVDYGYDKVGNLATEVDPGGTTSYSYDTRNLVTRMTLPDGSATDFGYDSNGRRVDTWNDTDTAHTSWAAHTRTSYDSAGRITRITTGQSSDDANRVSDLSYSYAALGAGACPSGPAAGTDTALRHQQTDHLTGLVTSYCYDTANRLTSATTPGGDSWTYSYDANGNRTQTTKNGAVVQTQTVNAADQLTGTGNSYDSAGNQTGIVGLGSAVYKADGQMTRLATSTTTSAYEYAGTDQTELIRETRAGGLNNVYAYGRTDANGIPLVKAHTVGLNTLDNTAFLVHDPQGTPIALRTPDGQVHYYTQDGLGSVTHLTNQNGATTGTYSYDPWGVTTPGQNAAEVTRFNPYGYAGGIDDPNSTLVHFGQRWYDPATGRFTQPDSLETLADPTRANRYEYAASNPINYVDPT